MELAQAQRVADEWKEILDHACQKIEIAGSIRRKKAEVKDIEIVAIPEPGITMFEDLDWDNTHIDSCLSLFVNLDKIKIVKNGSKMKQFFDKKHDINVDLFLVTPPAQWGAIYTIRTGPADFSKWLMTSKRHGGAMPGYLKQKDGALWNGKTIVETPTEESYFEALGIDWIKPENRK